MKLQSVAVYQLGLTEAQFWKLTPAKFVALCDVWHELEEIRQKQDDFRAGVICATIANVNRGKKGKVFKASDFFQYEDREEEDTGQSSTDTLLKVRLYNARVKRKA